MIFSVDRAIDVSAQRLWEWLTEQRIPELLSIGAVERTSEIIVYLGKKRDEHASIPQEWEGHPVRLRKTGNIRLASM